MHDELHHRPVISPGLRRWVYIACAIVVALALWLAMSLGASACIATSADVQDLAHEQQAVAVAVQDAVSKSVAGAITPAQLGTAVSTVMAQSEARTEVKMTKLQESMITWTQVASVIFGAVITAVGGSTVIVNRIRNRTSEERVTAVAAPLVAAEVERILAEKMKARGLT